MSGFDASRFSNMTAKNSWVGAFADSHKSTSDKLLNRKKNMSKNDFRESHVDSCYPAKGLAYSKYVNHQLPLKKHHICQDNSELTLKTFLFDLYATFQQRKQEKLSTRFSSSKRNRVTVQLCKPCEGLNKTRLPGNLSYKIVYQRCGRKWRYLYIKSGVLKMTLGKVRHVGGFQGMWL